MADDDEVLRQAIEAEEASIARRLAAEGMPVVGDRDVEAARLLSTILTVSLDFDDQIADETAIRLLAKWPWDVVRRAVDLAAQARHRRGPAGYSDVIRIAETLVEADRLATLRRRADKGDRAAAAELVAVKRAMRTALGDDSS